MATKNKKQSNSVQPISMSIANPIGKAFIDSMLVNATNVVKSVSQQFRRSLKPIRFVDTDGYVKTRYPNGNVVTEDVDKNGQPIKSRWLPGSTNEDRNQYWEQAPIMKHATDSIAGIYGINPELLRYRLNKEGFTDHAINENNKSYKKGSRSASNYDMLHKLNQLDFSDEHTQDYYGLDDGFYYIERGAAVPTPETNYDDHYFHNSQGRRTHAVHGETTEDGISLMGATLKMFRDKAEKDWPNADRRFLDEAASIYYNRGAAGGKRYLKNKNK